MATYGLDLSSHNGTLDFNAIKNAGNSFVILRAGYGWSTDQKDTKFEDYYKAAKAAGLLVGAYWYSYARTEAEAKAEADTFLAVVKGKQFEMPVYIDMEDADSWKANNGNPSGAMQAKVANTFMQAVEAAGYYVGIYSSTSWFNSFLTGLSSAYTKWIANWGSNDGNVHGTYEPLHQYTSVYTLNGKRFDRNILYTDFTSTIKAKGLNGFTASTTSTDGFDMKAWMDKYLGKFLNPDGVYDYQCVDVFKQLCLDLGMADGAKAIGGDGYALQIWNLRKENGYLAYFDEVAKASIQYGDVVIFDRGGSTPDSHVGICAGKNSNGTIQVFGQNQGGATQAGKLGSACNVITLETTYLLGGLRVKGTKTTTTTTTTTAKKTTAQIAKEVLEGKWGNGDTRKNLITAAGYDYNAVQAAVNSLVAKKSNEEIAKEVLEGKWGNGSTRQEKLTAAGYDYAAVQAIVNKLSSKKSVTEIAKEVIAGKWGNGQTRINKLKAAGYDYAAVQAKVNQLLK